jgi:two-component system cell cycle response regulator DivK
MKERTLLHVEDDPVLRKLIRHLFIGRPYRILEATDGEEALALAERERPHLILMDLQLPRLSGREAVQRLRRSQALRTIPVIAVTGFVLSGEEERTLLADFDAYLVKPFDAEAMWSLVERFLG